jgi:REP element-mobilizing transposase RayT
MSENYKFYNPDGVYFVSFSVVNWLDVFVDDHYIDILLEILHYCQKEKGMEIYAWCIMTNHVHLVFRSTGRILPGKLLGDFKRYTSKRIVKVIKSARIDNTHRRFLHTFKEAAQKSSNVGHYKFWRNGNHPIESWSKKFVSQKIRYVHNNPVDAGYVCRPEDWKYSSARDYAGEKGLLNDVVVVSI